MFSFKQFVLSPSCLTCGSLFSDYSLFCGYCFNKEISRRIGLPQRSHLGAVRHRYLLEWVPGESDSLSQMVYRMKASNSTAAWKYYARLFKETCSLEFEEFEGIIPIPGSKPESCHSLVFAKEFAGLTGLPVLTVLKKSEGESEQKARSAAERKVGSIYSTGAVPSEHFTKYIFIDDILTTGSSFLQAEKALNLSHKNIILTLFYRPRPA